MYRVCVPYYTDYDFDRYYIIEPVIGADERTYVVLRVDDSYPNCPTVQQVSVGNLRHCRRYVDEVGGMHLGR